MEHLRTIETAVSRELLTQFLMEKMGQFGFLHEDEDPTKIELVGLPEIITMKVQFKKEQEVEHINLNG